MRAQPATMTASPESVATTRTFPLLDTLCVLGGVTLIFATCLVLSRGRILWEDEVLGLTLLRDPSWTHMLREWSGGADNGGVLFYLTGRLWLQLFGTSALAFRMYSATGFAAAFAVLWITLRRYYTPRTLAVATGGVWFLGPQVVAHICEGRFYGLFLFAAMLTLFVTLRLAARSSASVPAAWLLLTFFAHAMLVTSHLLGLVYSVFLLAALIVCDAMRRHQGHPMRWRIYLSVVPAWLLLGAEHTAIGSALNNGKPHYWATRPGLHQLFGAYHVFDVNVNRALLLVGFALAMVVWRYSAPLEALVRQSLRSRTELYIVTLALALVPVAFFAESWIGTPIFVNRYLLPVTVVSIVFAAEAMRLIGKTMKEAGETTSRWRSPRLITAQKTASALFFAVLLVWIFTRLPRSIPQRQDYTQALAAALPSGSVVVLPDGLAYTEVIARQYNAPVHFHYLLDWQRSIAPAAPKADVSQFHLLSGWQHAGYFPGSVQEQSSFLQTHPAFYVVETRFDEEDPDPSATDTVLASLARTPGETVQPYPSIKLQGVEDKVWLVCRSTCPGTMRSF